MEIKVVSFDPSLTNLGICVGRVDINTGEIFPDDIFLIETKPSKDKRTRKSFDDFERAHKHARAIRRVCEGRVMAFAEMPIGSQSARAMASYGICVGLLASLSIPLIQVNPKEVKLAGFGDKDAAKEDMINWATGNYPHLKWFPGKAKKKFALKNEHLADAVAAMKAGAQTEDFQRAAAMFKSAA